MRSQMVLATLAKTQDPQIEDIAADILNTEHVPPTIAATAYLLGVGASIEREYNRVHRDGDSDDEPMTQSDWTEALEAVAPLQTLADFPTRFVEPANLFAATALVGRAPAASERERVADLERARGLVDAIIRDREAYARSINQALIVRADIDYMLTGRPDAEPILERATRTTGREATNASRDRDPLADRRSR